MDPCTNRLATNRHNTPKGVLAAIIWFAAAALFGLVWGSLP